MQMQYNLDKMFTKGSSRITEENKSFFLVDIKDTILNIEHAIFYPHIFTKKDMGKIPYFDYTHGDKKYLEHFNKFSNTVYSTLLYLHNVPLKTDYAKNGFKKIGAPMVILDLVYTYLIKEIEENGEKISLIVLIETPLDNSEDL